MVLKTGFPTVVCLCGSTRFASAYAKAQREETLAGKIVLSVGLLGHQDGIDMEGEVKKMLDELHLRKIDLADEVLILNPFRWWCPECKEWKDDTRYDWPAGGGMGYDRCGLVGCGVTLERLAYIGDSTRNEIAYATRHGKPIRYLNPPTE